MAVLVMAGCGKNGTADGADQSGSNLAGNASGSGDSLYSESGKGSGTSATGSTGSSVQSDTGFVVYEPGSYDSADTPVLVAKDTENGTMTFLNLTLDKRYTLEYDGTTCFYDKYGNSVTLSMIDIGEIVDVRFVKSKKHLTSMQLSSSAWTIESTTRYIIDSVKRDVTIGEDTYNISSEATYFSKEREVELQDIISTDTLTFRGIGTSVYSVVVDKGHGYLRLTGLQNFVGGWVEIGNSIIEKVTEDMLITVPEGSYTVKISYSGTVSEKPTTIFRNSESSLDFGDVVFEDPKVGNVLFSLTPSDAELYIDGTKADTSAAVELTYGLHQLICRAEGYTTVTQYLNVGQESAGIDIVLEENDSSDDSSDEDDSDEDSSDDDDSKDENSDDTDSSDDSDTSDGSSSDSTTDSSSSESSTTDSSSSNSDSSDSADSSSGTGSESSGSDTVVSTSYYKVYIDSPENVEIYLDGAYVGISPCSFKKVAGSHIVTLSKEGYVTRSYTISVDSEDKDISFSFVELTKESE